MVVLVLAALAVAVVGTLVVVGLWLSLRDGGARVPPAATFPSRSDPFAGTSAPLPPVSPFAASSPFAPPSAFTTAPASAEERAVEDALHAEVRPLLLGGDKISAIKLYRERTGASLMEAKNVIESWAVHSERTASASAPLPAREAPHELAVESRPRLLAECAELAAHDRIAAIKHWRAATGAGLMDAKNLIEALVAHGPGAIPDDLLARAWPTASSAAPPTETPALPAYPEPREPFTPPPLTDAERATLLAECVALARAGDKIGAIKRWRARTGCGLAEAKSVVDAALTA